MSASEVYGSSFYHLESQSSGRSAGVLVAILWEALHPTSVLDVGCGVGNFLQEFRRRGVEEIVGVEGEWVQNAPLAVPRECIRFEDLNRGFDLHRQCDLVICLEVAEHIEPENADRLVESLVRHGSVLAFSAAVPSQGGAHHVNLQWPEYWARKFRAKGFVPFDLVRPRVADDRRVPTYYAQNLIVYARPEAPAYSGLIRGTGGALVGEVPFVLQRAPHPLGARWLNRMPPRVRAYVYERYRSRWSRRLPGRWKDYL